MYNEAFGFLESPFDLTPDPKFDFLTENHQETLASMLYGIKERKGFISVSGVYGIGKTNMIRHLRGRLEETVKIVFIPEAPSTFDNLLSEIFKGLGLKASGHKKGALLHQLNETLIAKLAGNENLVLIIDDAEKLNKDAMEDLRLLSNLETPTSKLLQIVLVGQPELEEKLNSPKLRQLKQRIVIRRQMKALAAEESGDYIDHRLGAVGSAAADVFTPEALSLICRQAKGVPRAINILCDKALFLAFAASKRIVDVGIVRDAIRDIKVSPQMELVSDRKNVFETPHREAPVKDSGPAINKKIVVPIVSFAVLLVLFFAGREYFSGVPGLTISSKSEPPVAERKPEASPEKRISSGANKVPASDAAAPSKPSEPETSPKKPAAAPEPSGSIPASEPSFAKRAEGNMKVITVERGDSISSLCLRYYKSANITLIDHIMQVNPEITNPHVISVNQRIKFPEIADAALIFESGGARQIHLATFFRPEEAAFYKQEPALKGKRIEIKMRKFVPHGAWFRAVAGNFETEQEALDAIRVLKKKGLLPIFSGRLQ